MSQEVRTEADSADNTQETESVEAKQESELNAAEDTVVGPDQDDETDAAAIVEEALESAGAAESESVTASDEEEVVEETEADIIAKLEEQLAEAVTEKNTAIEKLQYEAAEFQNIRKRQEQRLADAISRANSNLIMRLLPVLDDLELAFANVPESLRSDEEQNEETAWLSGFEQIQKKLLNLLQEEGVTPIDASGEFDPNLHEAVLSEPSDEVESGHVISVLRTGYVLNGQVLRPSMVRVAS